MDKQGIFSTIEGKIIIGIIACLLVGITGGVIYYTVNRAIKKEQAEAVKKKKQKEIDGEIQWTNLDMLKMNEEEINSYKISIKSYLEKNLYGDITIIQVQEGSFEKKGSTSTVSFKADITTYGGFVTTYDVTYTDKKWTFTFYKDSYDYKKEAKEEGKKDYPAD